MNGADEFRKPAATLLPEAPGMMPNPDHLHAGRPLRDILQDCERRCLQEALRIHDGDKIEAARELGIGLSSLYRKMKELGISS